MLVLTRKANEAVMIGHEIEVVVIETAGCRGRIGFMAPSHVPVHRQEIYTRLGQNKFFKKRKDIIRKTPGKYL